MVGGSKNRVCPRRGETTEQLLVEIPDHIEEADQRVLIVSALQSLPTTESAQRETRPRFCYTIAPHPRVTNPHVLDTRMAPSKEQPRSGAAGVGGLGAPPISARCIRSDDRDHRSRRPPYRR